MGLGRLVRRESGFPYPNQWRQKEDRSMRKHYEVGQSWSYETLPGFEDSRIVIGAIENVPEFGEIICIRLTNAPLPLPGGSAPDKADIPFIPFARDAIDQSVKKMEGMVETDPGFADLHKGWLAETQGEDFMPIPVPMFLDMLASGSRD
jgi:hypothetical protein